MVLQRIDDKAIYHIAAAYLELKGWSKVECGYYFQWTHPDHLMPVVLMDALHTQLRSEVGDRGSIFS